MNGAGPGTISQVLATTIGKTYDYNVHPVPRTRLARWGGTR